MKTDEFIKNISEWCIMTNNTDDFTIGKDESINYRIIIDEKGYIWIREKDSIKRLKSSVNVNDVKEFRRDDIDEGSFYIICSDWSGFQIEDNEIYYYINGRPSGWGTAFEHFEKWPNGTVD